MCSKQQCLIVILMQEKAIFPVNSDAFSFSQSSIQKLNQEYKGAIILWSDGQQRTIKEIKNNGLKGNTVLQKLHSALFGVISINVTFSENNDLSLSELKKIIIDNLTLDQKLPEPFFDLTQPLDLICEKILEIHSVQELFNVIDLPPLDECLDIL